MPSPVISRWFFRSGCATLCGTHGFDGVMTQWLAGLACLSLLAPTEVLAQKRIPKAPGHDQCPLGYVNTLKTTCVSPIYYEVKLTNGEACPSGWMNVGAGYCRKK